MVGTSPIHEALQGNQAGATACSSHGEDKGTKTMWRQWFLGWLRPRLTTLLLLTIIVGLSVTVVLQHDQETRLRSALRMARNASDEAIRLALDRQFIGSFATPTTLNGLLSGIRNRTRGGFMWQGVPIYVDPIGLEEAGKSMDSPVTISHRAGSLKDVLEEGLDSLGLDYVIRDGFMMVTSKDAIDKPLQDPASID